MTEDSAAKISNLLSQASAAHHDYEQTLKGYDQDWPTWYAEYAIQHGLGNLLNQEIRVDKLSQFLSQSNEEYTKANPAQSWAEYTAQKILTSLN